MLSDAQQALSQVREALAAYPSQGEWYANGTVVYLIHAGQFDLGDCLQPYANAAYIAKCNPENIAAILAHVEAQAAEIERLRDLLRVEQALALRQDPFRCYNIECEWFGRPVRAGDCQCHHLQATTHRANVRDALANRGSDE